MLQNYNSQRGQQQKITENNFTKDFAIKQEGLKTALKDWCVAMHTKSD